MLIYLACPYTHEEPMVQELRARGATEAAAYLMRQGHVVFSPITHGHEIAKHLSRADANRAEFWMAQCLPLVPKFEELHILALDGWDTSKGVEAERAAAHAAGVVVRLFWPETLEHASLPWSSAKPSLHLV